MPNFHPRDHKLLDALEALPIKIFEAHVYRLVRDGRDPCQCSAAGNRWDSGDFPVLYTSLKVEGAIAEMKFHLMRGQPVFPSKLTYRLYQIKTEINGVFDLSEPKSLTALGLDMDKFGRLSYADRQSEYLSCQQISDAAHFLGSKETGDPSGILVPNARYSCKNFVLFCDHASPDQYEIVCDHGLIDWNQS